MLPPHTLPIFPAHLHLPHHPSLALAVRPSFPPTTLHSSSRLSLSWTAAIAEEGQQASLGGSECAPILTQLRQAEIRRAVSADAREAGGAAAASQRWGEAQRTLQREQAAWEAPGQKASSQMWEHLECEDHWRRRPLLTPNPNGSAHEEASLVQEQSGGSALLAQAGLP